LVNVVDDVLVVLQLPLELLLHTASTDAAEHLPSESSAKDISKRIDLVLWDASCLH
jgi:hypothetical protein